MRAEENKIFQDKCTEHTRLLGIYAKIWLTRSSAEPKQVVKHVRTFVLRIEISPPKTAPRTTKPEKTCVWETVSRTLGIRNKYSAFIENDIIFKTIIAKYFSFHK